MIHKLARYRVRKDAVPQALAAVEAFVDEVGRKEGGTAYYHAFQETADPTMFTHSMAFRTPSAEKYHQTTPWCKAFVAKLYPLCEKEPEFVEVRPVGRPS
jgi:quinol monooxygenase YgiN